MPPNSSVILFRKCSKPILSFQTNRKAPLLPYRVGQQSKKYFKPALFYRKMPPPAL